MKSEKISFFSDFFLSANFFLDKTERGGGKIILKILNIVLKPNFKGVFMPKEITFKISERLKDAELEKYLSEIGKTFRSLSPNLYFYDCVLAYGFSDKFSEDFFRISYLALQSWGMDSRGARLADFTEYKESLSGNKEKISKLKDFCLNDLNDECFSDLKDLFSNLKISTTNAKIVSFSKLMHFYLPNLIVPVDRKYSFSFFYPHEGGAAAYYPSSLNAQFYVFKKMQEQCRDFSKSKSFALEKFISDTGWNRNVPKVIDNLIIGYSIFSKTDSETANKSDKKKN